MKIIAHRINKIRQLKALPRKYGSEIDLRSFGSKIILLAVVALTHGQCE